MQSQAATLVNVRRRHRVVDMEGVEGLVPLRVERLLLGGGPGRVAAIVASRHLQAIVVSGAWLVVRGAWCVVSSEW